MIPKHLTSACGKDHCKECAAPVALGPNNRWYITMGHPGFNTVANNRDGYKSAANATNVYLRYAGK